MYGYITYTHEEFGEIKIGITRRDAWEEIEERNEQEIDSVFDAALEVLNQQSPATSAAGMRSALKKMLKIMFNEDEPAERAYLRL